MTRHTAQTSNKSYKELAMDGELAPAAQKVYDCIRTHGPVSNRDIHNITGLEIGNVCGRVGNLRDWQLIKFAFNIRDSKTHKQVQTWCIAELEVEATKEISIREAVKIFTAKPKPAQNKLWGGL